MRDGAFESQIAKAHATGEIYDLVAVGGGISGLAAAIFFQKYKGGRALVIDNHPIFGGEAKRNEFRIDGQRLIAHQGSAIFLIPKKGGYTDQFYDMIGMDRRVFDYQKWRGPTPEIPVSHSPYDVADQKPASAETVSPERIVGVTARLFTVGATFAIVTIFASELSAPDG